VPTLTSVRVELQLESAAVSPAGLLLAVAARDGLAVQAEELLASGPTGALPVREIRYPDGTRLHEFEVPRGSTSVSYAADVLTDGTKGPELAAHERWEFTRPSRFCPSDRLAGFAAAEFGGVNRADLPRAVADWVHRSTAYVLGSSTPTDGALETLVARQGVCRDFAHLVVALLRALDVPARLCAVYAPGLSPMDFHAVVEAAPGGHWELVDATRLAPRETLLRISSGRDATDTAFLTTAGQVDLRSISVLAVTDAPLPVDDHTGRVSLS